MYTKIRYGLLLLAFATFSFFIIQSGGALMKEKTVVQPIAHHIVDNNGKPSSKLLRLLSLVRPQELSPNDGELTLENIVAATQKEWLRGADQQRWHVEEKITQNRDQILDTLRSMNLFDEIAPSKKTYTYCLVLGSTVGNVRKRLRFVFDQWNKGLRFDELIFLGGERPLDPEKESSSILLDRSNKDLPVKNSWLQPDDLPTTETGGMQLVFSQAQLPIGFDTVKVSFIDSPMKKRPDGTLTRPTTGDTINLWLAQKPMPGSTLFVSHQPYVGYQDSVVRTLMPKNFEVETVGGAGKEDNISVLLDNVARWLYQEKARLKNSNS